MHLMIDLETLDTTPDCVVTQIGWCTFELGASNFQAAGIFYPDIEYQINKGRKVSWSTLSWWFQQDEAARREMIQRDTNSLDFVLRRFKDNFDWSSIKGVWGHGATFDISIMENLFRQFKESIPWSHKEVRDTRTLFMLAPDVEWAKATVKHSARDDAIAQALTVQRAYKIVVNHA